MKTETSVNNLKINRGTYANIQANLSSIGENELIITTDKNIPIPTTNDNGKVIQVNSSGEYELAPTITITTTTGSESISDGTNTLNVVTRDTAQTITSEKTLSTGGAIVLTSGTGIKGNKLGTKFNILSNTWVSSGMGGYLVTDIGSDSNDSNSYIRINSSSIAPAENTNVNLGWSNRRFNNIYGTYINGTNVAGNIIPTKIKSSTSSTYGLTIPETTSWTADKTIATTSDITTIPTTTTANQVLLSTSTSGTAAWSSGALSSSTTKPLYLSSSGVLTAGDTYAGGTAVTLNGTSKASSTASFYAPTGVGTSGQVLKSSGSGAPSWGTLSASDVGALSDTPTSTTDNTTINYLIGKQTTLPTSTNYYDSWVYFKGGSLFASSYVIDKGGNGNDGARIDYDSTNECIKFTFLEERS